MIREASSESQFLALTQKIVILYVFRTVSYSIQNKRVLILFRDPNAKQKSLYKN